MSIQLSTYAQLLEQHALLQEYAAECSIPEIGEAKPNPESYAALERAGLSQCFAVVDTRKRHSDSKEVNHFDTGEMIGFAALLMVVLPHYGKKVATVESIFITASERKSGIGRELMRTVEDFAKDQGCVAILYSAPTGGQFERVLDASKRYRRSNSVFVRNLR